MSQQSLDQAAKDRNRQIGIAIQQLLAANKGYVPELPKRKQEIASTMPRTAIENARGLYMDMSLGNLSYMQAELAKLYAEVNR